MSRIDVDGLGVNVRRLGLPPDEAPTVVFLHGLISRQPLELLLHDRPGGGPRRRRRALRPAGPRAHRAPDGRLPPRRRRRRPASACSTRSGSTGRSTWSANSFGGAVALAAALAAPRAGRRHGAGRGPPRPSRAGARTWSTASRTSSPASTSPSVQRVDHIAAGRTARCARWCDLRGPGRPDTSLGDDLAGRGPPRTDDDLAAIACPSLAPLRRELRHPRPGLRAARTPSPAPCSSRRRLLPLRS